MGLLMTDTSVPTRFAESDFRVGRVLNRTTAVFSRNFLTFFIVTAVASLPLLLMKGPADAENPTVGGIVMIFVALFLGIILYTLAQAIVLYGAFQDMRGRPVSLSESLQVGLQRFFPIVGLAIVMGIMVMLGFILLIVPGLILLTMWFVSTPACVVERLGPMRSLGRSSELTKGHRWKIFGLMLVLLLISMVVTPLIEFGFAAVGGTMLVLIASLLWNGVWGAFYAISVVVTYHDLRVAKEGIDIEQIAAVFD
jgi:hypothetical protein